MSGKQKIKLDYEKNFPNKFLIAGMDEAGRGPLAGPVVCACVIMNMQPEFIIDGINDSKKLSAKKREELYDKIKENAINYAICEVDERTIDEINILQATKLGMENCVNNLDVKPDLLLIDALTLDDVPCEQVGVIHGDALSYNIACASILAKVYRDRLMIEFDKQYPEYGFAKHKGYGTKEHIQNLKKYGACPLHRTTFIGHFVWENKKISTINVEKLIVSW